MRQVRSQMEKVTQLREEDGLIEIQKVITVTVSDKDMPCLINICMIALEEIEARRGDTFAFCGLDQLTRQSLEDFCTKIIEET